MKKSTAFIIWLVYGLLIVYGSLIPFEIRQYTFSQAVMLFYNIPYLDLDAISRADWIANILLYIPFAYLGLNWSIGLKLVRYPGPVIVVSVLFIGVVLAVSVEFVQIFFKPRTVSLNDLIAEVIGLTIGTVIYFIAGKKLSRLWREVLSGGGFALRAAFILYVLAFIGMTLFPFDLVMSPTEITQKLSNSDRFALFITNCNDIFRCSARLAAEVIIVLPFGIFLAMSFDARRFNLRRTAIYFGLLLGFLIEVLQFFLVSGTTQGVSILAKVAGVLGGVYLVEQVPKLSLRKYEHLAKPVTFLSSILFLIMLIVLNKWFSGKYVSWGSALQQLREVHFTPFYYHYFSSEVVATSSLAVHFAMYMPVGLLCWVWGEGWKYQAASRRELFIVALMGANLAIVMEAGKLFVAGKHPDPTDVLIGSAAAVLTYSGLFWLKRILDNYNILNRQAAH